MLYTAQYRYSGDDRLDITVKTADLNSQVFAPTWQMVKGYKNGTMSVTEYTEKYYNLLIERFINSDHAKTVILDLVRAATLGSVTVVCFCKANDFCHRYLLVQFLKHNWKVPYGGERTV